MSTHTVNGRSRRVALKEAHSGTLPGSTPAGHRIALLPVQELLQGARRKSAPVAGSGAALSAAFEGNALPPLRTLKEEEAMPEPAVRLAPRPGVRD